MAGDREVIGRGRTAEILAWGDGRAMKLYLLAGTRRDYVEREALVSRTVRRLGLPAPAIYDAATPDGLYDIDGRLGILYERIDGPTMMRDLGAHPWRLVAHSRLLAALHAQIHEKPGDGLPPMRPRIERSIERARGRFDERVLENARKRFLALPDVRQACHGDFHPDNVILHGDGPVVIDWGPATAGHPAADVAWTVLLYRYGGTPPGTPLSLRLLLAIVRRWSLRVYLRAYFALTGRTWDDVKAWLGVIALLRLADDITQERETLSRLVQREFARTS